MKISINGTLEEIAERGVEALAAQGTGAFNGDHCMYRCDKTGSRCIIGLLVTEDEANYLEDNWSENGVGDIDDLDFPDLESWEHGLLDDFQAIHDTAAGNSDDVTFVEDMRAEYATFRELYVKTMDENQ